MSRLTRDGTAEPVSRDQILRHARGQGNINFPCSADHEQDWQPYYPVDPYSDIRDDHTYIHSTRVLNTTRYCNIRRDNITFKIPRTPNANNIIQYSTVQYFIVLFRLLTCIIQTTCIHNSITSTRVLSTKQRGGCNISNIIVLNTTRYCNIRRDNITFKIPRTPNANNIIQ